MDSKITIQLLEKWIAHAESWAKDAEKREDYNDVAYYKGQIKAFKDIREFIS